MRRALAIACLALSLPAAADNPPVTPAAATAATSGGPPEYEDKLIDGGKLEPLAEQGEPASYNPDGPARSWRVEGYGSRIEQGGTIRHENGMVLAARLDTLQYGSLSLDATLPGSGAATVVTIWQPRLAFDNGWSANNGFGP